VSEAFHYRVRIDRRTTIKWLAATMAAGYAGCSRDDRRVGEEIPPAPLADQAGAAATPGEVGYGTDPDLTDPTVPWPRTMTEAELRISTALCDMIIPADERSPSASAVGVPDFIDEWISAPYPQQRSDRDRILAGLEWLDGESRERSGAGFAEASEARKTELLDLIAWPSEAAPGFTGQIEFFRRFRWLTVGAFYTTEAGIADAGYIGNTPITSAYPGPSDEAMTHLAGVLKHLNLSL
jgi:hypothetical protein